MDHTKILEELILLIAFAGLPGSGKSTIAKMLAPRLNVELFSEPEEEHWPELIHKRDKYGYFTGLSWFRLTRIQQLHDAKDIAITAGCCIIDSYYDILIHHYLGDNDFRWLIDPSDPYFAVAKAMSDLDYIHLPRADVIVFLNVEMETWSKMLAGRDRRLDKDDSLKDGFGMQEAIRKACIETAKDHGTQLVEIDQLWEKPQETMEAVVREIFG